MKTDARVRYTRRVIKESLLRLLEDRPVKRITVKEVCEAAQINRATFYAHFTDCFDVLNQMENDLLADFERSLSFASVVDVVDMIERIYAMIDQNAEVCRVLIFQNKDSSLTAKMIVMAHDKTIVRWKEQLTRATESDREMSGMGFTVMESFADKVQVRSEPGKGTEVVLIKNLDLYDVR